MTLEQWQILAVYTSGVIAGYWLGWWHCKMSDK